MCIGYVSRDRFVGYVMQKIKQIVKNNMVRKKIFIFRFRIAFMNEKFINRKLNKKTFRRELLIVNLYLS